MDVTKEKVGPILADLCREEGVTLADDPEIYSSTRFYEEEDSKYSIRSSKITIPEAKEYSVIVDLFAVRDSFQRRLIGVLDRKITDHDLRLSVEYFIPEHFVDPFWHGEGKLKAFRRGGGRKKVVLGYDRSRHIDKLKVMQDHKRQVEIDIEDSLKEHTIFVDDKKVGLIRKIVRENVCLIGEKKVG